MFDLTFLIEAVQKFKIVTIRIRVQEVKTAKCLAL